MIKSKVNINHQNNKYGHSVTKHSNILNALCRGFDFGQLFLTLIFSVTLF